MITKLKSINNLAVFQNFNWDTNIRDEGNNVVLFKAINILYGRNYSGKTTLSRIIRALEIGNISEKYENPQFEVDRADKVSHLRRMKVSEDMKLLKDKFASNQ